MINQKIFYWFLLLVLAGCTCEEEDLPIEPAFPDTLRVVFFDNCEDILGQGDCEDDIIPASLGDVVFTFNKHVKVSSVVTGFTISFEGANIIGDDFAVNSLFSFMDDGELVASVFYVEFCQLFCSENSCEATMTLVSKSLDQGVQTPEGQLLDGNLDGSDGDDFVASITIPGC